MDRSLTPVKTWKRGALIALSIGGTAFVLFSAAVWLSGGFRTDIFGLRVRATDPLRPLSLGIAILAVRLLLLRTLGLGAELQSLRSAIRPQIIAATLAGLITCVALTTNYGVGGGSDAYGYVSQADLWLAGDLTVDQEWVREAPWPNALLSAAPLAYRPSPWGSATVPTYAPGLPLMFAGAKWLVGQCGIVAVIALMAGLLVWTTFAIGRRVASPQIGAAAAWLMATCPVILFMMASPMSDVPAAAMSALAILGCLRRSKAGAFLAGLAMAIVILIRPNLTPLAAVLGFWLLVMDRQSPAWSMRLTRCACFGVGAVPGAIFLAGFNASVYGSALISGYGSLEGFFSPSHILPNIRNYTRWLIESQTPVAGLGLLAVAMPARWLGKREQLGDGRLLALMAAGVAALYLPYTVYGAWWFLRFLLPAWPAIAIGTAWLLTNSTGRNYSRAGLACLLLMGAWGLRYAATHEAFRVGWGDLRYVSAAHVVREMTPPRSVILSMQHSGTVNYYGDRKALRYDWIEPHRLESVIEWLKSRGHEVYILLEEQEVDPFRARFKDTPYGTLPDEWLIFQQEVGTRVSLFDTRSHEGEVRRTIREFVPSARRCCEPARQPLTGSRP